MVPLGCRYVAGVLCDDGTEIDSLIGGSFRVGCGAIVLAVQRSNCLQRQAIDACIVAHQLYRRLWVGDPSQA